MVIIRTNKDFYSDSTREQLLDACGLIPMFFVEATESIKSAGEPTSAVAESMDAIYGMGGFQYPMGGTVSEGGTYGSEYEEDEDLEPYATVYSRGYVCYIYPYAITAIRGDDGETFIGRFD